MAATLATASLQHARSNYMQLGQDRPGQARPGRGLTLNTGVLPPWAPAILPEGHRSFTAGGTMRRGLRSFPQPSRALPYLAVAGPQAVSLHVRLPASRLLGKSGQEGAWVSCTSARRDACWGLTEWRGLEEDKLN